MNTKAQGLSLNTIIIAIMVLLVLVMLIAIFTGVLGKFIGTVDDCKRVGGQCKPEGPPESPCGENSFDQKIAKKKGLCKDEHGEKSIIDICCEKL